MFLTSFLKQKVWEPITATLPLKGQAVTLFPLLCNCVITVARPWANRFISRSLASVVSNAERTLNVHFSSNTVDSKVVVRVERVSSVGKETG